MATRLFWSWFVTGSDCYKVASQIENVVGDSHSVFNRSDLFMQLGQVVYILARAHDLTVREGAGAVTIECKDFSLVLTEKWAMERQPIEFRNVR